MCFACVRSESPRRGSPAARSQPLFASRPTAANRQAAQIPTKVVRSQCFRGALIGDSESRIGLHQGRGERNNHSGWLFRRGSRHMIIYVYRILISSLCQIELFDYGCPGYGGVLSVFDTLLRADVFRAGIFDCARKDSQLRMSSRP